MSSENKIEFYFLRISAERKEDFTDFLKNITPLKKQSESSGVEVLEKINSEISKGEISPSLIPDAANCCFQLFDYPKTGIEDNFEVLRETLPRHITFIFTAFKNLKSLPEKTKEEIYNNFLDLILDKQLWKLHKVDVGGQKQDLTRDILKTEINKISVLDFAKNDFRLLSKQDLIEKEKISMSMVSDESEIELNNKLIKNQSETKDQNNKPENRPKTPSAENLKKNEIHK